MTKVNKGKDPAFLFYPADASEDTQFMNRLERGAYFDLVKSQRLFHGYAAAQLRKVLGKDYEEVWPSLSLVLKEDSSGFFIPWVRDSILNRKEFGKKQSEKALKRWGKNDDATALPGDSHGNTMVMPIIENENEIKDKGVQGEKEVDGSIVFYESSLLEDELLKSGEWMNDMSRLSRLEIPDLVLRIKSFCLEQKHDGMGRTLRELRTHFMRKLLKDVQYGTGKNTGTGAKFVPDAQSRELLKKYQESGRPAQR